MIDATLDPRSGDYLTVDTDAWLDDMSTANDSLTECFQQAAESILDGMAYPLTEGYATDENVQAALVRVFTDPIPTPWAAPVTFTGLYGDANTTGVATVNEDTFLDNDIAFWFLHVTYPDPDDPETTEDQTLILVTGSGYWMGRLDSVDVRTFDGMDDAEAFGYTSGCAGHTTDTDCGAEWIVESGGYSWYDQGSTRSSASRIDDMTREDDDGTHTLVCPECGTGLAVMVG